MTTSISSKKLYADKTRGVSAVDGSSKAKIERAAVILFSNHGIDGVSTKQIAHSAGLSEGLIYRHFKSKSALARALMVTIHNRLTEMITVAASKGKHLDGAAKLKTQILYIVRHYCGIADDDWPLFRYHILHLHHFSNLSEAPEHNPLKTASELLKSAMDEGLIPKADPDILACMALGIVLNTAQAKALKFYTGRLTPHISLFTDKILAVIGYVDTEI